jgi:epoxyqueuosine reductase QueG
VQDFCAICLKCVENCPSSAIPGGAKINVRGVDKWPLDVVRCLHYWRVAGSDCGLCMRVCPYSHPPTALHNLVRRALGRSAVARPLSLWAENFFYGRRASVRRPQRDRAEA